MKDNHVSDQANRPLSDSDTSDGDKSVWMMPGARVLTFQNHSPRLGTGCFVAGGVHIIGDVEAGAQSSFWFNVTVRGDVHRIRIGERTNIQDHTMVHVTGGQYATTIGSEVTVGHSAVLHGCRIDDRVLVGMGACILDGAHIGEDSMVAAGSLVSPGKTFPPGHLILGSPAKVVRPLTPAERLDLSASAQRYVDLASAYRPLSKSVPSSTLVQGR